MIVKRLIVINGMTGQETPVRVGEGTTPESIVGNLGLEGYRLARVKDRHPLPIGLDILPSVQDGEKLFAFAAMTVGGGL